MAKRNPDQFLDFSAKEKTSVNLPNQVNPVSQIKDTSNVNNNNNISQTSTPIMVAVDKEDSLLPDPTKAREETLAKINTHYKQGIEYFGQGKLDEAEQELVKAMKPVLSKNTMRALYVELEDCKGKMLSAIYHLGKIYERSEKYQDNYSKAAAIFQYCAGFAKKYNIDFKTDFIKEAYATEAKFLASIGAGDKARSYDECQKQIYYYTAGLALIRATTGALVDEIRDWPITRITERAKAVEEIYAECTSFFVNHAKPSDSNSKQMVKPGLVQQLLAECYEQLGVVPEGCEHAIIGFGSLAGGKMTPWSDLEFGILINEDKPEYKEYFRNLTKLLHIKVINLGETPLRSIGIESLNNFKTAQVKDDWFWDEVMTSGVSFDGAHWHACKLPLGRQGYKAEERVKDKDGIEKKIILEKPDYELILTPAQMSGFQSDKPVEQGNAKQEVADGQQPQAKSWYGSDKHLVQALKSVALIDGSQELLDTYRKATQVAEDKAIIQARALEILAEDIDSFSLKLGDEEEGKLFDVKKGIYRVGDRIVEALANYYGIEPEPGQPKLTVWEVIDKMAVQGLLSLKGAKHLKEAISIATELRLATYCHNKGQKEGISTYVPVVGHLTEEERKKLIEETFVIKDSNILHHFYYVVLRLQKIAKGLVVEQYNSVSKLILALDVLSDQSEHMKGLVHARFLEYEKALENLELAKEEKPEDLIILNSLLFLQNKISKVNGALDTANQMLALRQKKYASNPNHPDIARSYNNLGIAAYAKGEYDAAIKYYKDALEIRKQVYASNLSHPDIASSYNNLGNAAYEKGEYDAAIQYYKDTLDIMKQVYASNPNHPDIASGYSNLGAASSAKGEYAAAIKYYEQALEIRKQAYASNPNHPDIAASYNNLGEAYRAKGEYDAAIKYYNNALEIRKQVYISNPTHPSIAASYNNLGIAYDAKGEYDAAIKYYNNALEIRKQVYASNPNHPDIAGSYGNLGIAYDAKGEYDAAIKHHQQALEIQKQVYASTPNHPDIGASYNNLGNAAYAKGEYDAAIKYYKQALEIRKQVYASTPNHPDIAISYNNLGEAYYRKGAYDAAIKHHQQALEIQKQVYANNPVHPYIAISYNNLGNTACTKGKYDAAMQYHQQALEIWKQVYASTPNHPDIAMSYNNLGNAHYAKGECDAAIAYHEKALKIRKQVYASNLDHPDIASSYNNLGAVYLCMGDFEQAKDYSQQALKIVTLYQHKESMAKAQLIYDKAVEGAKLPMILPKAANTKFGTVSEQESTKSLTNVLPPQHTLPLEQRKDEVKDASQKVLSDKLQKVEVILLQAFGKLKLSAKCSDATLEMSMVSMEKKDLEEYCKLQLRTNAEELEFENKSCLISLDRKAIELLRAKIVARDNNTQASKAEKSNFLATEKQDYKEKESEELALTGEDANADA